MSKIKYYASREDAEAAVRLDGGGEIVEFQPSGRIGVIPPSGPPAIDPNEPGVFWQLKRTAAKLRDKLDGIESEFKRLKAACMGDGPTVFRLPEKPVERLRELTELAKKTGEELTRVEAAMAETPEGRSEKFARVAAEQAQRELAADRAKFANEVRDIVLPGRNQG